MFEDQEDEQGRNLPAPADQPNNEDPAERVEGIGSKEEQHEEAAASLFPQTPHRESVIFFSTGKKLLRAPCFDLQEDSICKEEEEDQHHSPSVQEKLLPARETAPCTSEPTSRIALQTGSAAAPPSPNPSPASQCFCVTAPPVPPSPPQASAFRRPAR